jgi:hypothetical protein
MTKVDRLGEAGVAVERRAPIACVHIVESCLQRPANVGHRPFGWLTFLQCECAGPVGRALERLELDHVVDAQHAQMRAVAADPKTAKA